MDKPPIDFDKLKDLKKEKVAEPEVKVPLPKPHPSLTDPYYWRRNLINIDDFDEWTNY